jgi:hypothetical protein
MCDGRVYVREAWVQGVKYKADPGCGCYVTSYMEADVDTRLQMFGISVVMGWKMWDLDLEASCVMRGDMYIASQKLPDLHSVILDNMGPLY